MELLRQLGVEWVAGAIVGLLTFGTIARSAIHGWIESRKKLKEMESNVGPMRTALSISWDRDQIERALQALESMAKSSAIVAAAQALLSDKERTDAKETMEEILERLSVAERTQRPPRKPRKRP